VKNKITYRARLETWLADHNPPRIEPPHFAQLLANLAPIQEPTLRRALRESGWPLAPLVEGVRQDNLDNLQRTLTALATEYEANPSPARQAVLTARTHAEWNLKRHPDDAVRQEAFFWLRTWLENPTVFPVWCRLRVASK
jgi:hypothetical protein